MSATGPTIPFDDAGYCQAPKLRDRIGWQLWLGDGWATITDVQVRGDDVLITVEDGTVYRVGYVDAVRCRRPDPLARNAFDAPLPFGSLALKPRKWVYPAARHSDVTPPRQLAGGCMFSRGSG